LRQPRTRVTIWAVPPENGPVPLARRKSAPRRSLNGLPGTELPRVVNRSRPGSVLRSSPETQLVLRSFPLANPSLGDPRTPRAILGSTRLAGRTQPELRALPRSRALRRAGPTRDGPSSRSHAAAQALRECCAPTDPAEGSLLIAVYEDITSAPRAKHHPEVDEQSGLARRSRFRAPRRPACCVCDLIVPRARTLPIRQAHAPQSQPAAPELASTVARMGAHAIPRTVANLSIGHLGA
jgi:hypothetical protein